MTIDKEQQIKKLTDKELDNIADIAIETLQNIITSFNLGEVTINEYEGSDRELILDINGENLAILIGQKGKTLDAIQNITNAISYKKLGFYYPVIIDVEGYKSRKKIKLEKLAKRIAKKVSYEKQPYSLYPMNPYNRRIIHCVLASDDRVETHSEGEGRNRHIVVTPL